MDSEVRVTRDVPFAEGLGLDVYEGGGGDERAAILSLHGGGWFEGDKHKDEDLARALARAGYLVFEANYRLAPAHPFPAARDDVLSALAWVKGSPYAFDRTRVAFVGTSAGGNLAVEGALATGLPAVSWSGPLDLVGPMGSGDEQLEALVDHDPLQASSTIHQSGPDVAVLRHAILELVAGDRGRLREASPLTRVTSDSGPIYVANSLDEFIPVSGALDLARALAVAGVPVTLELFTGTKHAKGYQELALPGSLAFLARALGRAC